MHSTFDITINVLLEQPPCVDHSQTIIYQYTLSFEHLFTIPLEYQVKKGPKHQDTHNNSNNNNNNNNSNNINNVNSTRLSRVQHNNPWHDKMTRRLGGDITFIVDISLHEVFTVLKKHAQYSLLIMLGVLTHKCCPTSVISLSSFFHCLVYLLQFSTSL